MVILYEKRSESCVMCVHFPHFCIIPISQASSSSREINIYTFIPSGRLLHLKIMYVMEESKESFRERAHGTKQDHSILCLYWRHIEFRALCMLVNCFMMMIMMFCCSVALSRPERLSCLLVVIKNWKLYMKTGRQIYRFLPTSFFVLRILDSFVFWKVLFVEKKI